MTCKVRVGRLAPVCLVLLLGQSVALTGCSASNAEEEDELCEEVLSADEKVRCRDTTMVAASRAYRLPNGQLKIFFDGEPVSSTIASMQFQLELTLSPAAQAQAPEIWNIPGSEGISSTFRAYSRKALRGDDIHYELERGSVTISDYDERSMTGVLRNMRYKDNSTGLGVALIPTMRFSFDCIGEPATDDVSCQGKCGVCQAVDRCGNAVTVQLDECS